MEDKDIEEKILTEEGEDEGTETEDAGTEDTAIEDDAEGGDDTSAEDAGQDSPSEPGGEDDAAAEDAVENAKQPFGGLDLRAAHCFGFRLPEKKCWKYIADQAEDLGWKQIDVEQLEKSFSKDVEDSYLKIAEFKLVNVDDDMAYYLWFDNNKALWGVEILDSPEAEISVEERADFFKSEMFKKIAKKTYSKLVNADKTFNEIVKQHVDNGEMLLVDDVKLDAVLHFLSLDYFLKNLLNGKYLGY